MLWMLQNLAEPRLARSWCCRGKDELHLVAIMEDVKVSAEIARVPGVPK